MKSAKRAAGLLVLVAWTAGCTSNSTKPGIDSTTTTSSTSTTSTTTTSVLVSFATTVWPEIQASNCTASACHGGFPATDARRFTNQAEAFTFAVNRSVSGNPAGSLFLQKPGGTASPAHGGGTNWPPGSAGNTAATNWINGGLRASNDRRLPDLWAAHRRTESPLGTWARRLSARPLGSGTHE